MFIDFAGNVARGRVKPSPMKIARGKPRRVNRTHCDEASS
jgi:hypothetical protein